MQTSLAKFISASGPRQAMPLSAQSSSSALPGARQTHGDTLPLSFRAARGDDAPTIARIYNDSVRPSPIPADAPSSPILGRPLALSRMQPLAESQIHPWLALHERSRRPLWMAQVGDETVGWLSLLGFSDRPGCSCAAEISVYVAAPWQGQGIGSRLLHKATWAAMALGIDRLMAFVWKNNTISLKLFHARGYCIWGALPGVLWVDGGSQDMIIFGQELDHDLNETAPLA